MFLSRHDCLRNESKTESALRETSVHFVVISQLPYKFRQLFWSNLLWSLVSDSSFTYFYTDSS